MTVSEQITRAKTDYDEVYHAGKLAVLKSSEVLNGAVSGEAIAVHDVNPVEHKLGVKLTSDTITDFSAVEVSRYGKNLFDINNPQFSYYNREALSYPITITDGIIYSGGRDGFNEGGSICIPNPKCPISVSFDLSGDYENPVNRCTIRHFDGLDEQNFQINTVRIKAYPATSSHIKIENIISDKNYISIGWYGGAVGSIAITNLQIALGTTATEYEPYKESQTATANTEGTVEGLTSLSPNMTLMSNTDGVVIDLEYYKDIDLAFENLTDVAEIQTAIDEQYLIENEEESTNV